MAKNQVKLGKKLGVVHDPRTFKLGPLLLERITPPKTFHIGHTLTEFPMFGNDDYGDCTCAAHANRIIVQQYNSQQSREIPVTTDQVLKVYSAVTGFRKEDPSTDNGAYCLDVLNYMRRVGMGVENDYSTHNIWAYASVNYKSHTEVKLASYLFGGVYVGAGLPVSAQRQDVWDVTSGSDAEWGSWGGHAMHTVGYDEQGPIFITWGALQHATWAWWDKYVDETYAVFSEDWIRSSGKTTNAKLDVEQLKTQLANLD
jgi:hypothetical protein